MEIKKEAVSKCKMPITMPCHLNEVKNLNA